MKPRNDTEKGKRNHSAGNCHSVAMSTTNPTWTAVEENSW